MEEDAMKVSTISDVGNEKPRVMRGFPAALVEVMLRFSIFNHDENIGTFVPMLEVIKFFKVHVQIYSSGKIWLPY
jgi:hypothetical protein